jgi:hypothetical protein
MPRRPQQPPSVTGPEAGPAKPAAPGPREPPSIAASILPQRKRDAARHADDAAEPPESVKRFDDMAAAEEAAVKTSQADNGGRRSDNDK